MTLSRRLLAGWPVLLGLVVAALWPLTTYAVGPLVLPAALVCVGFALLVLWRPEYGIGTTIALAPWTNMVIGGHKLFHLLLPGLAIGVLCYGALTSARSEARAHVGGVPAAALFLSVVALLSTMQALRPAESITKLFVLLTAVGLFFATEQICTRRRQLLVVIAGAIVGLVLVSGQGLVQHYLGPPEQFGFVDASGAVVSRVQGSFGHPNSYAGFIAVLIPLTLAMLFSGTAPARLRWLAGSAFCLAVPALVFSYTRGAIVALFAGSLLWLAILRPRVALASIALVGVVALTASPALLQQRLASTSTGEDVALRSDIWNSALEIYGERPVLGVGLNNFSTAYANLPATAANVSQRRLLHQRQLLVPPHAQNLYLNVLAEQGSLGLIALLAFAVVTLRLLARGSRARDPIARAVCLALGAGIMTLAVHSMLDVTFPGEIGLPIFGLLAVAASFLARERRDQSLAGESLSTAGR